MANLTNIIGGQPYYDATDNNSKSLLDFWKGTQTQYDDLKRTGAILAAGAPTALTILAFSGFATAAGVFNVGDIVYITGTTGSNTTRTVAEVTAVDKYDPETLYLITA
mgnify:CR=1 FL=1